MRRAQTKPRPGEHTLPRPVKQLDMFEAPAISRNDNRPRKAKVAPAPLPLTIEQRFEAFATANPIVLTRALQIARAWIARGDRYISVKAIYETMRTASVNGEGDQVDRGSDVYRLNNTFTASIGKWLLQQEPGLVGKIRTRERKL